jgi:hypothetical protein
VEKLDDQIAGRLMMRAARSEPAGSENIPNADPTGTQPRRNNAPEKNRGYRKCGHSDAAT